MLGQSPGARIIIPISQIRKLRPGDATDLIQVCAIGKTQSWASEVGLLSIQTPSLPLPSSLTSLCPLLAGCHIPYHSNAPWAQVVRLDISERGTREPEPPTASQNSESEDGPRIACDCEVTGQRGQVGTAQGGHKRASSDSSLVPSKPKY